MFFYTSPQLVESDLIAETGICLITSNYDSKNDPQNEGWNRETLDW